MGDYGNPHIRPDETDADFCRRMGWMAGTFLIGNEGYGNTTIKITAVGESGLLAYSDKGQYEQTWTLSCRNWHEVSGWQAYHGA